MYDNLLHYVIPLICSTIFIKETLKIIEKIIF